MKLMPIINDMMVIFFDLLIFTKMVKLKQDGFFYKAAMYLGCACIIMAYFFSCLLYTSSWNKAYVDFFPGQHDMLLFVRLNFEDPVFFQFDDFDNVLLAVDECDCEPLSSLTYIDGFYVLTIYPLAGDPDPICFSAVSYTHLDVYKRQDILRFILFSYL